MRQQGDLASAQTAFTAALKLAPRNAELYRTLAKIALAENRPDRAIARYRELLNLQPQDMGAQLALGEILKQQNRLDEASTLFRSVIAQHPFDLEAPAQNGLGVIFMKQKKLPAAIAAFRKAVELHPAYADAFGNLGDALVWQNQPDAAIAAFRPYLNLYNSADVYTDFGNFLSRHAALAPQAPAAYRKAIALDKTFTPAYIGLGKTLTQQQQFNAAIAAFQSVIDIIPSADAYNGLGLALMGQNRLLEAIQAFRQAIAADLENREAPENLKQAEARLAKLRKK